MSDEEAILDDTTAGEVINHQYIMIRVGKLTPKSLLLKLSMLNYQ